MKKLFFSLFFIFLIFNATASNNQYFNEIVVDGRSVNHPLHDPGKPLYMLDEHYPENYPLIPTPPPAIPVRMCAEWEPAVSVLIRYPLGLPWNLISQMAQDVHITCFAENVSSAQSAFSSHGISLSDVDFVQTPTNTYWTRDYGPWFVFDGNDTIGISDHVYNRIDYPYERFEDDSSNWTLAPYLGVELWKTDLMHTGGNFMCDGHCIGMSSDDVYSYSYNSTLAHDSVDALMEAYWGIHTYNTFQDPLSSYIDHIDCYAKFLTEEKIVVIRNGVEDYYLDQIASQISNLTNCYGRNYEVVRLSCPSNHNAAYVNCLILNDNIYVPLTNNYDEDTAAIHFYEREMLGYSIQGFYDYTFDPTDAIHCRTKAIYDPGMLYVDHNPNINSSEYIVYSFIHPYSGKGVKTDSVFFIWKLTNEPTFTNFDIMNRITGTSDSFEVFLPLPVSEDLMSIDYYIVATDSSGRTESDPYTAPGGYYTFEYEVSSVEEEVERINENFNCMIHQSGDFLIMDIVLENDTRVDISAFDVIGREVGKITSGNFSQGNHQFYWTPDNRRGENIRSSIYFIIFKIGDRSFIKKVSFIN